MLSKILTGTYMVLLCQKRFSYEVLAGLEGKRYIAKLGRAINLSRRRQINIIEAIRKSFSRPIAFHN